MRLFFWRRKHCLAYARWVSPVLVPRHKTISESQCIYLGQMLPTPTFSLLKTLKLARSSLNVRIVAQTVRARIGFGMIHGGRRREWKEISSRKISVPCSRSCEHYSSMPNRRYLNSGSPANQSSISWADSSAVSDACMRLYTARFSAFASAGESAE
jgi:hypothetical protein